MFFHVFSVFVFHNRQVNINEHYKSNMFCMNSRFTLRPASCKKNGHVVPSTLLFFHGGSSTSDISWSPSELMSAVSEEHHFKRRGRRKCLTPSNNSQLLPTLILANSLQLGCAIRIESPSQFVKSTTWPQTQNE